MFKGLCCFVVVVSVGRVSGRSAPLAVLFSLLEGVKTKRPSVQGKGGWPLWAGAGQVKSVTRKLYR